MIRFANHLLDYVEAAPDVSSVKSIIAGCSALMKTKSFDAPLRSALENRSMTFNFGPLALVVTERSEFDGPRDRGVVWGLSLEAVQVCTGALQRDSSAQVFTTVSSDIDATTVANPFYHEPLLVCQRNERLCFTWLVFDADLCF